MRERVASVMNRFGTDMTLSNPEGTATVRGFFWAVNSKSWQSMESEATLLGKSSGDSTCTWGRRMWKSGRGIPSPWGTRPTCCAGRKYSTTATNRCTVGHYA